MGRFYYQQNSFGSGVLTPKLYGRTDIEEYRKAVRKLDNFMILPTGGVRKRPGIERIGNYQHLDGSSLPAGAGAGKSVHIPMTTASGSQLLVRIQYETGLGTIQFLLDGVGKDVYFNGFGIAPSLIDAARLNPYGFNYVQVGDYMVITHSSGTMRPKIIQPINVLSSPNTEYQIANIGIDLITITGSIDYLTSPWACYSARHIPTSAPNNTSLTMTASTATVGASGTLTASDDFFKDTMIGERIILDDKSADPGRVAIYLIVSTSGTESAPTTTANVICEVAATSFSLSATDFWYEEAWSDRKGWPKTVTAFENRLVYGSTEQDKSTLWASAATSIADMSNKIIQSQTSPAQSSYLRTLGAEPNPALPYEFKLSLGASDRIEWLATMQSLFVGTTEKEIQLNGGDSPISARNFPRVDVVSRYGSSNMMPSYSGSQLYFLHRNGHDIVELKFFADNGKFGSQVVTDLSDMIMHGNNNQKSVTVLKMATDTVEGINYLLTSDNKVYSFTSSTSFGSTGFAKIIIDEDITPFDVFFVPRSSYGRDDDYLGVFYTLTGYADQDILGLVGRDAIYSTIDTSNLEIPWNLDDYVVLQNDTVDTELTLPVAYLENKEVTVIDPNGAVLKLTTPTGSTTLAIPSGYTANSYFVVGVPYSARIETLDLAVGPNFLYSSSGDEFRIDTVHFDLFRTYDLEYGTVSDGEEILYPLEVTTPPAVSGRFKVNPPMTSSNETRVVIQSSSPFNVTVSSLTMRGKNTQVS